MTGPGTPRPAGSGPVAPPVDWRPGPGVRLAVYGVLLVLGIGYLVLSVRLGVSSSAGPGPGFFPLAAVGLMLVCVVTSTVTTVVAARRAGSWRSTGRVATKVLVVLGTLLVYLVLVGVLGHLLVTTLIAGVLLRTLGDRPWWQVVLTAVVAASASDLLFTGLLGLPLPTGLLGIGAAAWI